MHGSKSLGFYQLGVKFLLSFCLFITASNYASAQTLPDGTLGQENSIVTPGQLRDLIEGGAIRDTNLFHSFTEFNVSEGQNIYFANPEGVANILTRVTGFNPSNIFGTLGVDGAANLILLNPNGINFGSKATLDVSGSFLATTADSVLFDNSFEFSASNPQAPPLITINIPLGLQYGDNPGAIVTQKANLQVQPGQTLSLLGGDVLLQGGKLTSRGGQIELGGLTTAGIISINEDGSFSFPDGVPRADVTLANRANVIVAAAGGGTININADNLEIASKSKLSGGLRNNDGTLGDRAGDISINATESIMIAGQVINNTASDADAGNITLTSSGDITLQSGIIESSNSGGKKGAISTGNSGNIFIQADGAVNLLESSKIRSSVNRDAQGQGGNIQIRANSLLLDAVKENGQPQIDTGIGGGGLGDSGIIDIQVGELAIIGSGNSGSSGITSGTGGSGNSGGIQIAVEGAMILTNRGKIEAKVGGTGNAGDINITAESLSLSNTSFISASVRRSGEGADINITTRGSLKISGASSSISTRVRGSRASGQGGNVNIQAQSISTNGGFIRASTEGIGNAGNVLVSATDFIELSQDNDANRSSGFFNRITGNSTGVGGNIEVTTGTLKMSGFTVLNVASETEANSGNILVNADRLELSGGAQILATTFGNGSAGKITINATEEIVLSGVDPNFAQRVGRAEENIELGFINILSEIVGTDGAASGFLARTLDTGDAGDLDITTPSLIVEQGAIISADTIGAGTGGNLSLNVRELVIREGGLVGAGSFVDENAVGEQQGSGGTLIVNASEFVEVSGSTTLGTNTVTSSLFATAQGEGDAGELNIFTEQIFVRDGAEISASTAAGVGGSLNIEANESVLLSDDSQISSAATEGGTAGNLNLQTNQLTLQDNAIISVSSPSGQAGNLNIAAHNLSLNHSQITAETAAAGGANINLDIADILLLANESLISATAFENANGGNVTINSGFLVALPPEGNRGSDIIANAQRGDGGRVNISADGIFGISFQPVNTSFNDITVSSEFGSAGTVELNSPDTNPAQTLANLPEIAANAQPIQGCRITGEVAEARFIDTGRGGLPPSPDEPLSGNYLWEDMQTSQPIAETETPLQIVEAQGWVINDKGNVVLVTQTPTQFTCNTNREEKEK